MEIDVPLPLRVSDGETRELDSNAETASVSFFSSSSTSQTRPPVSRIVTELFRNPSSSTSQSVPQSAHQPSSSSRRRNNSTTVIPSPAAPSSPPGLSNPNPNPNPNPKSVRPSSSPLLAPSLQSRLTSHSSPSPRTPSSYCSSRSAPLAVDPRPPPTRRQPASRSSHGIETSTGPPPALITQRSYTAESGRKHPAPTHVAAQRPRRKYRSEPEKSVDAVLHRAPLPTDEHNRLEPSQATRRIGEAKRAPGKMTAAMTTSGKNRASLEDDQDSTLRNLDGRMSSNAAAHAAQPDCAGERPGEDQSTTSQEDLFLILARSNSLNDHATDAAAKSERRRSRTSNFTARPSQTPLPPANGRPSSRGSRFPGHVVSSSHDAAALPWGQSRHPTDSASPPFATRSATRERRYAASAHPLDAGRRGAPPVWSPTGATSQMRSGSTRESSPELPAAHGPRQSIRELSPGHSPRAYRQSNLSYTTNGHYRSSPFPDPTVDHGKRAPMPDEEGTESTVSTTAPSTIWDDVEDLKHRMRKLELTGTLPVSSDAAVSNVFGERPPTATTTMTTISSSPNHGRADGLATGATTARGLETVELHPLLHSALAKSKPFIDPDIYVALAATASDALTLAAMTAPGTSQAAAPATTIDRRLRRKADSMCRSLTELCIALAAEKSERDSPGSHPHRSTAGRSISIHHDPESGQDMVYLRAASEDPELRSSSQVMNRLEARRASLLHSNTHHAPRSSPREANTPTQTTASLLTTGRTISRRATLATDRSDERPPSRPVTEISHFRPTPSSAERPRREYTSQHPLPTMSQHSPSAPSSLPVRRTFFSAPSMDSPLTPSVRPSGKRYLDRGPTPPKSVETARAAEVRRERMASFGGFGNGNGNGVQRGAARVARQMASDASS